MQRRLQPAPSEHVLQFYDTESFLCDAVGEYVAGGLDAGEPVLVIASPAHAEAFSAVLQAREIDVATAVREQRLLILDAEETLKTLMSSGSMPDEEIFREVVGAHLARQAGANKLRVRAYGEMADLLWGSGRHEASLRLEELWNGLAEVHSFSLLCAHALSSFYGDEQGLLHELCRRHGSVYPAA